METEHHSGALHHEGGQQHHNVERIDPEPNARGLIAKLMEGRENSQAEAAAVAASASTAAKSLWPIFHWRRKEAKAEGSSGGGKGRPFKPQCCPHCSHPTEYTSKAGLRWHWRNACTSVFASGMTPSQRGRESIRRSTSMEALL